MLHLTSGYVVTPNDTEDMVEWTTSNPGVASITTSGTRLTIKAESTGTAVLTATATSGVSASINVTIVPKKVNVTGISITKRGNLECRSDTYIDTDRSSGKCK